jgi:methylenetetrahydrofolate--tRNA-(uracil-5-)-methyltransferase
MESPSTNLPPKVLVIGAGLAGSEAAHFLAKAGISVVLVESKTLAPNPSQKLPTACELVCTNSLKSQKPESSHGMLKTEMDLLGSLVLSTARECSVPAGDALAVDRILFSQKMTDALESNSLIHLVALEVTDPLALLEEYQCQYAILATGPLTTPPLENWIKHNIASDDLYFYDAIAPIVDADSLDMEKLYFCDRHQISDPENIADYLNVPLTKEEYYAFVEELQKAEKVASKNFEELKYFEACLPIDTMAVRGPDTLRFSCMKPIGLPRPDGTIPFAAIQLRRENLLGDAYNIVGFQTRLTYGEQKRIFRTLPGFANAEFIHLGSVHRNTFLNAKNLLNADLSSRQFPQLHFAGQITGVEGYTESAACGLFVAAQILQKIQGRAPLQWPVETALGALINYILTAPSPRPTNVNGGLFPPVAMTKEQYKYKDRKKIKNGLIAARAKEHATEFSKALLSC